MSLGKSKKTIANIPPIMELQTDDDNDTDSEIELKPTTKSKKVLLEGGTPDAEITEPYVEIPKKRKPYNITPEQREAKRMQMLKAREVKVKKYEERMLLREQESQQQQQYLEKQVLAKAEKSRKEEQKLINF